MHDSTLDPQIFELFKATKEFGCHHFNEMSVQVGRDCLQEVSAACLAIKVFRSFDAANTLVKKYLEEDAGSIIRTMLEALFYLWKISKDSKWTIEYLKQGIKDQLSLINKALETEDKSLAGLDENQLRDILRQKKDELAKITDPERQKLLAEKLLIEIGHKAASTSKKKMLDLRIKEIDKKLEKLKKPDSIHMWPMVKGTEMEFVYLLVYTRTSSFSIHSGSNALMRYLNSDMNQNIIRIAPKIDVNALERMSFTACWIIVQTVDQLSRIFKTSWSGTLPQELSDCFEYFAKKNKISLPEDESTRIRSQ